LNIKGFLGSDEGLLDFDELHGFVEVVEDVHALLRDPVGHVCAGEFGSNQSLLCHGVEYLHQGLPGEVGAVHDAGGLVHALLHGAKDVKVNLDTRTLRAHSDTMRKKQQHVIKEGVRSSVQQ